VLGLAGPAQVSVQKILQDLSLHHPTQAGANYEQHEDGRIRGLQANVSVVYSCAAGHRGLLQQTCGFTLTQERATTSKLLVSGSGFKPYAAIDIYFDTKDEAKAIANGSGSFSKVAIQTPKSALPGKHWVSAVQRSGQIGAQAPFLVNTNWSQYGFTSDGRRTNPYENVLNPSTVGGLDLLWSYTTGGAVQSSPSVADGVVYVASDDLNNYALKASTGALLWSYPGGSVGNYSSPAVANGVVYVSLTVNLSALNASTGSLLWSYDSDASIASSPAVANGVVYVASFHPGYVSALNASTGTPLWTDDFYTSITHPPAVANGVVYIGNLIDPNLTAINASTGAVLWIFTSPCGDYCGAFNSSPAVANGVVYASSDDGNLYALNATTGTLLWDYPSGQGAQPAVADGVVYADGPGGLFALNATTGALLWSSALGGAPAVADGVVYIVGGNDVYALNATTGAFLWSYATGGGVSTRPAIANGVVYIGSDDGNVYAFGLTGGARGKGASAKKEAAPNPPDLRTLIPDFNLKVPEPVVRAGGAD
jgi:outer membrane protein assembly factor BamB